MIIIEWVATILSLVGAVLNIRKDVRGFYLWLVANGLWMWFALDKSAVGMALTFGVYFLISGYGIWQWGRK